ncbi:hypothetical protein [Polaribacter glomeratus]|uniref:Lipoprotein n=1 Tax=Polaribacter glomeratus TaxID=102 RepID=A0A2S7WW15_9FLAO|nr:hypothetical protein [Polaribacter glomeratus]PQJ81785.1 hypothetical protein BTO16_04010 [Polaribacter glomeratus]TXD66292.1 hypothetical protein ESX12_05760 [Polaribacter glomeratus]
MKSFLKKTFPFLLLIGTIFIIGSGCGDGNPEPPQPTICASSENTIETALSSLTNRSMDFQVHEYVFTTNVAGNICAIGYQSLVQTTPFPIDNSTVSYKIEIVDGPAINSTFSTATIDYITLNTPFAIVPEVKYTIKRTGGDGLNSSSGRTAASTFPYTSGNITFLSSNFVDSSSSGGGPVPNNGIPKIYFKFDTN